MVLIDQAAPYWAIFNIKFIVNHNKWTFLCHRAETVGRRHLFLKAQHCHHYIHGITSASRMDAENCRLSLGVRRRLKCYDDSSRPRHRTKTTRLVRNFSQQALFVFWRATHAVRIFKLFTFCFESQSDVGKKIPASKLQNFTALSFTSPASHKPALSHWGVTV